jgi:hypothetical protein
MHLHFYIPSSSCPNSTIVLFIVSKDEDVATIKFNDHAVPNLIQVLNKKKKRRVKWEVDFFFQDIWVAKFPWVDLRRR